MRSFVVAVALFACACGDVLSVSDAGPGDARTPDSAEVVTCAGNETLCNATCADTMTSELYCGNCNTQCSPTQGCLAGACVPYNVSCRRVRDFDPTAPDGVYVNPNTNGSFYCSYSTNQQWEIVTNSYLVTPPGFQVARASDFNNADFVNAFITLYNHDIGFRAVNAFTPGNCCMGPVTGLRYSFGTLIPFTGVGTSIYCNSFIEAGTYVSFGRNAQAPQAVLPTNYFSMFPVAEVANCSDASNAAFFWRRTTI